MEILGIDFFSGDIRQVIEKVKNGGLLLVPAAPALVNIMDDQVYYAALKNADIVIPDSGYMVLIWNLTRREKIQRVSGLEFITAFFDDKDIRDGSDIFLIDPTLKEAEINHKFLTNAGFKIGKDRSYVAPFYNKGHIEDPELLKVIEDIRPKYIVVNLGGGVQEKLGAYLKENLSYRPAIICTGAAIAFLTGQQVNIPTWADKFFLGWLFRCISRPGLYVPRYIKAIKLIGLMLGSKDSVRVGR